MARRKPIRAELEAKIGHAFADPDLLERALTHVSSGVGARNYQRLEFLGDRVLGLAVSEILIQTFPHAPEGELSQRLSELVRRETCAAVAEAWEVGPHLRLGLGESQSGGRRNRAILSDVAESIIGAVFLDAGYAAARALVARALDAQVRAAITPPRDAKTALQEWAQGRGWPTPVYVVVDRAGPDHAPRFQVAARIPGTPDAVGTGGSKRIAEQNAALAMLTREGVWRDVEVSVAAGQPQAAYIDEAGTDRPSEHDHV